jgi:light-harvesting complex 1 beta chain
MADNNRSGSMSGLTEAEAQEFHAIFIRSFLIFTVIAVIAHILVWQWRPWLPGVKGYAASQAEDIMPQAIKPVTELI